ncbi:MAG: SGNH/GDSL hydrolase family protein [Acidobacteriia bacterium]|nr:SGNH/GDSL hydrolase family protein [Terriglobia bacterium]
MKETLPPKRTFLACAAACACILSGLLLLQARAQRLPNRGAGRFMRTVIAEARGRHALSSLAFRNVTMAGYYENLLRESEESEGRSLIAWLWTGEKWSRTHGQADIYIRQGFLLWEPRPGFAKVDLKEGPVFTNSHGMFAPEYPVEKSAAIRRIALLGDSLARGYGIAMDRRFDKLFERRLNAEGRAGGGKRFEVLNFAVTAYRPTQMYDVAVRKASLFQPDVYMITLTELGVSNNWSSHLAQLLPHGIDPRYDFLRQALAAAGVHRNDEPLVAQTKLARYQLPILRSLLLHLKKFADLSSANVIVVFLSGVEPPELSLPPFRGIRELVTETGVTMVDLLDTFSSTSDLDTMRVAWYDPHPNPDGHQLIANNLYRKLREQPAGWSALVGR